MMVVIDTNILLHLLRKSDLASHILEEFDDWEISLNDVYLSIVSAAEIRSIGMQQGYGNKKMNRLDSLLQRFIVVPIKSLDLVKRYAEIDAFSQGKLLGRPLRMSARNMGKNDLWIASTASVLNFALISTDADFEHLDGAFLEFIRIDPEVY